MIDERYAVILTPSTGHAIRAEKILHQAGIASKLIPVPRHISSSCGVCVRIERDDREAALRAMGEARVQIEGVHDL